jgi:hypothetical protein
LGVVVGAAIAVTLTSCSGSEAEPAPPDTTTETPKQPSPSPGDEHDGQVEQEPAAPPAAHRPGRAGAIAYAKHFLDLLNYAKSTGSVQGLRSASAGCDGCEHYADEYKSLYDVGGSYRGALWRATTTTAYTAGGGDQYVFLTVAAQEGAYTEDADSQAVAYKPSKYKLRLRISRQADGWRVTEMLNAA